MTKELMIELQPAMGGLVDAVRSGSLADRAGLRAGARLLSVNGRLVRDVVDYQFDAAEESVTLVIEQGGERRTVEIEKHPDDDIGLEFAEATFDGTRICTNKCFFCFLKGLPKGLRRTMYVKDDDYRLSFLHGNFVTLTNLSDEDWLRLEEQQLSPLNVSVHATELDLRRRMLGNDDAEDILDQLRRLGSIGIRAQTQVVLCPGVNDGAHLERTVNDLAGLFPTVQAVSVVPVGASIQYAERMSAVGKEGVSTLDRPYARTVIKDTRTWQRRWRRELGATFCYLSDEFYLTAEEPVPPATNYDGFPQYENGVGMTRALLEDWQRERRRLQRHPRTFGAARVTVACAELIAPTLAAMARDVAVVTGLAIDVVSVPNTFFGQSIRVSGLLGAGDFIGALRGVELGDVVFLPRSALDYFGRHFLDDGTPEDVERVLGRPVGFASTWSELLEQLPDGNTASHHFETEPNVATNGKFWAIPAGQASDVR
jgi:putative radical SAM enzyme (TIGR03279 family)